VLLAGLALMGQSRGFFFAVPVVAVVFLLVTPRRVRTSFALLVILAGVATTIPAVLDIYDENGPPLGVAADGAVSAILLAGALTLVVVLVLALADRRVRAPRRVERGAGVALAVLAALALAAGAVVYGSVRGDPARDVADAWDEFKTKPTPAGGTTRLGSLGSNRYDFWRVAWNQFESAPLKGAGADTFQQAYLADARSHEQPRYPHSVELRTLSQTGLVGTALLSVALAAALLSAWRAMRLRRGAAQGAAAAGTAAFVYWFVHGSVDWFWELPALGGTAFALLGLAAGLAPRRVALRPARRRGALAGAPAAAAVTVLAGLALLVSLGGPWLAERYIDQSLALWREDPDRAFDRLDRARGLNPLSATPDVAAGSIALQLRRAEEAEAHFREAVDRDPGDSHSQLRLGAILFNDGRRDEGVFHLRQARRLDRRDEIIRPTLARARRGREIDIRAMNQAIADRYRSLSE
jgi:O-antigen ligase